MLIFFDAQMDLEFGIFSSIETQKQSIWYKKFGSELYTKVPALTISVRRFYYMNIG